MSIVSGAKKIGRPRIDSEAINVRMPRGTIDALDAWIATQEPRPRRPEAIRRALAEWLKGRGHLS